MTNPNEIDPDIVDGSAAAHFQLIKGIGEGAFSSVYLGCFKDDPNNQVAIKRIPKEKAFGDMNLNNECRMMRQLGRHPNILSYIGLYTSKSSYHVVSEYMEGGELLDILIANFDNNQSYSEVTVAIMMRQVISAVDHCHRHRILHRDLKPENILVKFGTDFSPNMPANALRVSDFGLAVDFDDQAGHNTAGTTNYMAPERLRRKKYDCSSDVWSIGVIMYILLAGQFPFFGTDAEICKMVCDPHHPSMDFNASPPCLGLMKSLLDKNPARRPTTEQLLEHPWTTGEVASTKAIGATVKALRLFNARNKFKATIKALIATKRLEGLLSGIRTEQIALELVEFGVSMDSVITMANQLNKLIVKRMDGGKCMDDACQIDVADFKKIFDDVCNLPDPVVCDELTSSFERNGKIDPRKVCLSLASKLAKNPDAVLDAAFDIYDVTGDGVLEMDEFVTMMSSMMTSSKPVSQFQLEEEFNDADVDKSKTISKDEFITAAKSNHRIIEYLNMVEKMLNNSWEAVRQRVAGVKESKTGYLYVRESGFITSTHRRFCSVESNVFEAFEDETKAKSKFKMDLSSLEATIATENGLALTPENIGQMKKSRPRFDIAKRSFEAKSFEELLVWIDVLENSGVTTKYVKLKSGLMSKFT